MGNSGSIFLVFTRCYHPRFQFLLRHAKLDDNIDEESGKQSIDNIEVSATSLKPSLFRNGREIGHNPEGDSDGKETDFITIVPEVLNGNGNENENVNNG